MAVCLFYKSTTELRALQLDRRSHLAKHSESKGNRLAYRNLRGFLSVFLQMLVVSWTVLSIADFILRM